MKYTVIAASVLALFGGSAFAATDFVDTAQVISSKPIIERVAESRQECEPAPAPKDDHSIMAPILGGIVGGLLGHTVGRGSGNTAATIAGAAGGAAAGGVIAKRAGAQPQQVCRTVQSMREVVNGYDVVYRYNGRDVNVAMDYDPGPSIKVGVAAIVDERPASAGRDESGRDRHAGARPTRAYDGYGAGGNPDGNYGRSGTTQF